MRVAGLWGNSPQFLACSTVHVTFEVSCDPIELGTDVQKGWSRFPRG
jgi:hypothetical protein